MPNISELLGEQPLVDENDPSNQLNREEPIDDSVGDVDLGTEQQEEEPAGDPAPTGRGSKKVPVQALHEERTKHQSTRDQLIQEQAQRKVLEERFNQTLQLLQQRQQPEQQAPQEDPQPDFADDPKGYVDWLAKRFEGQMGQSKQFLQEQQQQQQIASQHNALTHQVAAQEAAFRATTPDYDAAMNHYISHQQKYYEALGANPIQAKQLVGRDISAIAQNALQTGGNTAQIIYNVANVMGYTKGQQPQQQPQQAPKKQAPTSLSSLNGAQGDNDDLKEMSLDKVASMSNEEFNAWFDKQSRMNKQKPRF